MASYAAIADASETLIELLRDRITERGDVVSVTRSEIALVSPADVGADSDVRLSLFLYDVTENSVLKNQEDVRVDSRRTKEAPLALDLRYVLTAFPSQSGGDETATALDQQRMLGLAMQVLYDNSILGADELPSTLAERDLQITLEDESLGAMADVWNTFGDTAMQPAVTYLVSPVMIDATREQVTGRVTETERDYRTPGGE
ncbi:MAG: DUF4255 domain-containing protein [Haloarculaceae archaeon]